MQEGYCCQSLGGISDKTQIGGTLALKKVAIALYMPHCIVHANKVLNVFIFISISNVNVQLSESTTLELIMGLCSLMRQQ